MLDFPIIQPVAGYVIIAVSLCAGRPELQRYNKAGLWALFGQTALFFL
jgi:hypothetical protein